MKIFQQHSSIIQKFMILCKICTHICLLLFRVNWSFNCKNLNFINPRMMCTKLAWIFIIWLVSLLCKLKDVSGCFVSNLVTQRFFEPSLVKIGLILLEKNIFQSYQCTFPNSLVSVPTPSPPTEMGRWTNLNFLHQSLFCAKFAWNWFRDPGAEDGNVKSLRTEF